MLFDLLYKHVFNMETIHRFFFFLGTPGGELLKRFTELVFYFIIIYMLVSEFKRHRKREYKYLIVGFLALLFRQAVMSVVLWIKVFGVLDFNRFAIFTVYLDNYLEAIALLLLVSAFVFPAFKHVTIRFQKYILVLMYTVTIVVMFDYVLYKYGFLSENMGSVVLQFVKIVVLLLPFYAVPIGKFKRISYKYSMFLAFLIYLMIPISTLLSLVIFGGVDQRVIVAQHPLPFLSIMLLMRSVFLRLVDKAFLRTKLKESEEAVKHEKEMSRLKDYFISLVSHELRTPVTSVKLYLSLMEKGKFGSLTSKQRKAIKTIVNENNRLADLINDLLTINQIESKKIKLNVSSFDLNEILDPLYFNLAKENGMKVVNKVGKRFKVKGDKVRLKQVFVNLMNNAIKFSDAGSKITVSGDVAGDYWMFSVQDEGKGIPSDEIPKLFDKFYQVESVVTRKEQGIGLGLSIIKHIVGLHKGSIDIKSTVGKGSVFTVKIPKYLNT